MLSRFMANNGNIPVKKWRITSRVVMLKTELDEFKEDEEFKEDMKSLENQEEDESINVFDVEQLKQSLKILKMTSLREQ